MVTFGHLEILYVVPGIYLLLPGGKMGDVVIFSCTPPCASNYYSMLVYSAVLQTSWKRGHENQQAFIVGW